MNEKRSVAAPCRDPGASTVRGALAAAAVRLAHSSDSPRLDAEVLMAHALGIGREEMLLARLDDPAPASFEGAIDRRVAHEPVAYIIGRRAFWTIELEVGPGVLIPRPDSETLIEAAIARFGSAGPTSILDLGTGPGTLLLAALDQWPAAAGLGVDLSPQALAWASHNADRLGLADRATFRTGEWADGLEGQYDLILCNPPYVESGAALPSDVADWEPAAALFGGPDGLDAFRRLAPEFGRLLAPGGIGCIEIGAGQQGPVANLFRNADFRTESRNDLNGIARCLVIGLDRR
jgi:release factor glutamine methyltransferase